MATPFSFPSKPFARICLLFYPDFMPGTSVDLLGRCQKTLCFNIDRCGHVICVSPFVLIGAKNAVVLFI